VVVFPSYDEQEWLYLASHWIPREVYELVYATFVLFFMRMPRRGRMGGERESGSTAA
jgi:hypothetical protein